MPVRSLLLKLSGSVVRLTTVSAASVFRHNYLCTEVNAGQKRIVLRSLYGTEAQYTGVSPLAVSGSHSPRSSYALGVLVLFPLAVARYSTSYWAALSA